MKKRLITMMSIITMMGLLAGCATDNIGSPCKDFGKYCSKTPVNSWSYKNEK